MAKALDITKLTRIHCIGIGGIGLSGLADLFVDAGVVVSGSDVAPSLITDRLKQRGVTIFSESQSQHIDPAIQLVIRSAAVPDTDPEVSESLKKGIPVIIYPEALAQFSKKYAKRIVISGTNGKSTTTAMIATIFETAGLDPTAMVGSMLPAWGNRSSRLGESDTMIMEACEWRGHMMLQKPTTLVLTNLELEHTDFYKDLPQLLAAFETYANTVPENGTTLLNQDREELRNLSLDTKARIIRYGTHAQSEVRATNVVKRAGVQELTIQCGNRGKITVRLRLPGDYNVENALAATACAYAHQVPLEKIAEGLNAYQGLWRRFQLCGTVNGAHVYSDYAHHPDAVKRLLEGAKDFDPGKRVTFVFQPHQHRRTKDLFEGFTKSFGAAGNIYIADIYDVAGREAAEDQDVSARDLVEALLKQGLHAEYAPDLPALQQKLVTSLTENDTLIVAGAGDIYLFAEEFIKNYGDDR